MQVLGELICVLCTVGFGMFVWVYVAGTDAELIVLSVIWMDPVSPWPVVLVWVSITQQLSVTGNLLCARYFMYFGSFTRILQSRRSYHYFIHEESRAQRGYLLKVTQVCGRCRICPWIPLKPKLVLLTAILLLTFSTTASPSERDCPGWRAHTEDMGVTSFPIRCSLFQMVFEECAWTFFFVFACLVTAILWLVVSVWLVYLIIHFFFSSMGNKTETWPMALHVSPVCSMLNPHFLGVLGCSWSLLLVIRSSFEWQSGPKHDSVTWETWYHLLTLALL